MEKETCYRLNTGKVIRGQILSVSCERIAYCPISIHRWSREQLNVFTKILHGGYLVRIYCIKGTRQHIYWDWSENTVTLSEWVAEHKL